jgi:hypothetical protein
MPPQQLVAEDVSLVESILTVYPDALELVLTLKDIIRQVKFPINDAHEFADAVDGAAVREGVVVVMKSARELPAYVFPIASEADLVSKMLYMERQSHLPAPQAVAERELRGGRFDASGQPVSHGPIMGSVRLHEG